MGICSARDVVQRGGLGRKHARGDENEVGGGPVAVEAGKRVDLVPDGDAVGLRADRFNHSGHLIRGGRGQAVDRPGELIARNRGGVHAHERVGARRFGHRQILQGEMPGLAPRGEPDRAHVRAP